MKKTAHNLIKWCVSLVPIVLLLVYSDAAKQGAANGVILCGNVIIPSLFPFTVFSVFLMESDLISTIRGLDRLTKAVFHLSARQTGVWLLSLVGGYPIGVTLLNNLYKSNAISKENARLIFPFCVHAGPAFIILYIGTGLLGSSTAGILLLMAHIFPSFLFILIFRNKIKCEATKEINHRTESAADCFVSSVAKASESVFKICAYVVLFSTITQICGLLSEKATIFKAFVYFLEVTVAVSKTRNIYVIAFLLGFAGVSIWCQVLSTGKEIRPVLFLFVAMRCVHGGVSGLFLFVLLKFFRIPIPASRLFYFSPSYSGISVTLSLFVTLILFIISVTSKNYCRNLLSDMV